MRAAIAYCFSYQKITHAQKNPNMSKIKTNNHSFCYQCAEGGTGAAIEERWTAPA
jgi:hypothetical protein